jgi:hypothetical protein
MTADPKFQPVFGPNGAVLNAPTMTPEMRAKFDDLEKPASKRRIWLYSAFFIAFVLLAPVMREYGPQFLELIRTSPWWGGVATGVLASALVVNIVWAVWIAIRRWELLAPPHERELHMPAWARRALAVCDIVLSLARAALLVVLTLTLTSKQDYSTLVTVWGVVIAVTILALALSAGLRHMAGKLGWIWQVER